MTGTLDRIETLARSALNGYEGYEAPWYESDSPLIADAAVRLAHHVLALVSLAKAAQDVANHQWSPLDRDWPDGTPSPIITLRAALARLEES